MGCCRVPLIFMYRFIVWTCYCCFSHRGKYYSTLKEQLESRRAYQGGWYENVQRSFVSTRDTFFILMAKHARRDQDTTRLEKDFLERLRVALTNFGQVPWGFETHWFNDDVPVYHRDGVPVVDANAQFIIMACRYCQKDNITSEALWLASQRAWEWLSSYIDKYTFIEPVGASWAYSSEHDGYVLLTNVYVCQAARSMELLAYMHQNKARARHFQKIYDRFRSRIVPEIYKTQETLPRILAVRWNMVQDNFIQSFNAQISNVYVPLVLDGPLVPKSTWISHIKGADDQFISIIWPWVGFLWILTLAQKSQTDAVRAWRTAYMGYGNSETLYDMYSPNTFKPVRRAFLKANAMHALTIALQQVADELSFDEELI